MKNKAITAALVGALVLGGIAFAAVRIWFGPTEDKAISIVPSGAFAYGSFFIRPSNSQKMAIEDILEAAGQSSDEVQESLSELLDRGLQECDASFETDVDPWLGDQVAFFFSAPAVATEDPDGAVLVAARDEEGARDFLEKCRDVLDISQERDARSYEGVDYDVYESEELAVGFVEGFLVAGTEGGFKAAVDTNQGSDSLADSTPFKEVAAKVNDDNLALIYFNPRPALEAARELEEIGPDDQRTLEIFGDAFEKPYASTFFATSRGFVIEGVNPWPLSGPLAPVLEIIEQQTGLEDLPEDSWLAVGVPEVGRLAGAVYETALEVEPDTAAAFVSQFESQSGLNFEDHIVDGLGGARLFLSGGFGPGSGGAVVVKTDNVDTATALSDAIETALEANGVPLQPLALEGYDEGFTVPMPGAVGASHVVVDGNRIIGALGDAAFESLDGSEPLRDSEVFTAARELLGEGYEPYVFVDLNVLVNAFESFVAPSITGYPADDVEPILRAISHLTIGAKRDGDYILQRVVIGAEGED